MADDISDKRRRSKKKRSSLLTWKKKFNIKKRFTNKLPLHKRHIRSLMSSWSLSDVRSVLTQYEISTMLKQLSLMADKSRLPSPKLGQDIRELFKTSSCCDMKITCCALTEDECLVNHNSTDHNEEFKVHQALIYYRWPHLRGVMKSQLARQKTLSMEGQVKVDSSNGDDNSTSCDQNNSSRFLKIHLNGITSEKLSQILNDVYDETGLLASHPRKLHPLPTTDDSLHIRNSRGKQAFRYTIFECDPPPVMRRNGARRKHSKHRFSMDERILSRQQPNSVSSRALHSPKRGEILPSGLQSLNCDSFVPMISSNDQKLQSEKTIPHTVQDDLLKMYHDAKSGSGDIKIIFSCDSSSFSSWMTPHARRRDFSNHYQAWISHCESSKFFPSSSREWQDPLYCHKAILAARSPYFRKLLGKQVTSPTWLENNDCSIPTLEMDGLVIPPRYMGAVLHTMYTDKVNIPNIYERVGQGGMPMGGVPNHFHLRDAMMLHHIGRFIEFPKLVSCCEEFIVEHLDQNNLPQILHWASLPHGSQWVTRQVNNFIRERFTELLSTGVLFALSSSQIVEVLKSDFVNSSELDILKCALRWGEHELLRRIEEREPNLLTHTAHSVSRSKTASARRRELIASRIEELHECTAPILACVRMQHVLPPNHELFANAVKRGVISRPPTDLIESTSDRESSSRQWIKSRVDFVPPRLFQPYMDETRNILDERFAQENDCVSLRSVHSFSRDQTWCSMRHQVEMASHGIPDALYMVGQARIPTSRRYGHRDPQSSLVHARVGAAVEGHPLIKFIGDFHPVPKVSDLREMIARERELRSTYVVNKVLRACIDCCHANVSINYGRAYTCYLDSAGNGSPHEDMDETEHCNRCVALYLVRLFLVRERGLPDCAVDLLRRPGAYYHVDDLRGVVTGDNSRAPSVSRFERSAGGHGRFNSHCEAERTHTDLRDHNSPNLHPEERISFATDKALSSPVCPDSSSGSVVWRKGDRISTKIPISSHISSNIPAALSLTESSSSEEEEFVRVRRKKKSLSRKGSSSTTSYHSIPDVAASANSSLQRLRNSAPRVSQELPSSPLFASNHAPAANVTITGLPHTSKYFSKLTETETCDSITSGSISDESSSERETEPMHHHPELKTVGHEIANVPHDTKEVLPASYSQAVLSPEPNPEVLRRRPQKIRPTRRPLSTGMSELFQSSLSFIDDEGESSKGDGYGTRSKNSRRFELDVPELVKDGTLPRASVSQTAVEDETSYSGKPDIYPKGSEAGCSYGNQCGQYFFCSLTRENMSASNKERKARRGAASFSSFAINNKEPRCQGETTSKQSVDSNLAFLSDEAIFL